MVLCRGVLTLRLYTVLISNDADRCIQMRDARMGYLGGTHGDLEVHFFRFETTETHGFLDILDRWLPWKGAMWSWRRWDTPPDFDQHIIDIQEEGCPGTEVDGSMVRINGLQPQINPSIYFRSFTTHFPTIDSNFRPIQVGLWDLVQKKYRIEAFLKRFLCQTPEALTWHL